MSTTQKKVIIVESPSKSHTIKSYLDNTYEVYSSKGHIKELATTGHGGLGINIDDGFIPTYKIIDDKKKLVEDLKKACKGKTVYLATDPDREGEAIAYHLANELGLNLDDNNRIEFHEITKKSVSKALEDPHKIDMNLVESQEARRMIDRILGFELSKLLKRRINSLSAGRVQSVVLKLSVDLEEEINSFIPLKYYELEAYINNIKLKLIELDGTKVDSKNKITDRRILENLKNRLLSFRVSDISQKEVFRKSKPVYTTSTLQQDAINLLNLNPTQTMRIAQRLYEGKQIGNEFIGLITYMRTDSTRISDDFVSEADKYILEKYGKNYIGNVKNKEQKNMQDAHEGIRPTSIDNKPELVKKYLTNDEYRLYKMIYERALASLMANSIDIETKIEFTNIDSKFESIAYENKFEGYKILGLKEDEEDKTILPSFKLGEYYNATKIDIIDKETEPKKRYTEATLIKDMETLGIGRPSTYAQTIEILLKRDYVNLEKKFLIPTEQGKLTTKSLDEYFSDLINIKYTAQMEDDLDLIAKGKKTKLAEMQEFYDSFKPLYENAAQNMERKYPIMLDELCPICGNNLVVRLGKYGEFTACSNYPTCTYIKHEEKEEKQFTGILCPNCGGHIIKRVNPKSKNKEFYSCDNYPDCKTVYNDLPTNEICPNCGAIMLVDKYGNKYCSDKCYEKTDILCPNCKKELLSLKIAKRGKNKNNRFYVCPNKECGILINDEATNELCPLCGMHMFKDINGNLYCYNHKPNDIIENLVQNTNNISADGQIICNKCNKGHMVKRVAKNGANKGKEFYACSRYPKCKNIISIEEYNNLIKK